MTTNVETSIDGQFCIQAILGILVINLDDCYV